MDTYDIEFSVRLRSTWRIAAQSEGHARQIAEQLLDDNDFCEDLQASLAMDPYCGWDELEASVGMRHEDRSPTMSQDDLERLYGVSVTPPGHRR